MEETIKVKYKALDYRGNSLIKTIKHQCPVFEEKTPIISNVIVGFESFPDKVKEIFQLPITVAFQQEDWLTELDKSSLMDIMEWNAIIDWEIVRLKPKKQNLPTVKTTVIEDIVIVLGERFDSNQSILTKSESDQMILDIQATYEEIKNSIKGLSKNKQFEIIFASMGLGIKAASTAYKNMTEILTTPSEKQQENKRLNDGRI